MPKFKLLIARHETFLAEVEVEAPTRQQAIAETEDKLNREGWDAVYEDDGDYEDCWSEVIKVLSPGE